MTRAWSSCPTDHAAWRDVLIAVEGAADTPDLAQLYRSTDGAVELLTVSLTGIAHDEATDDAVDAIRHVTATVAPAEGSPEVSLTGASGVPASRGARRAARAGDQMTGSPRPSA